MDIMLIYASVWLCTKSEIPIDKKSKKIKKEFLAADVGSLVSGIKFNVNADKNGEFFSSDKKKLYKLIRVSDGKRRIQKIVSIWALERINNAVEWDLFAQVNVPILFSCNKGGYFAIK